MASIAHYLPSSIVPLEGSSWANEFPGVEYSKGFDSGPLTSRVWSSASKKKYSLAPATLSSTNLIEFEAFLHNRGGQPVWIKEPVSAAHNDLYCGGLADGTKTTFPIPVYNPSSVLIYVDGVPQYSGYTLHTVANVLTQDKYATIASHSDIVATNATEVTKNGVSYIDTSCAEIPPDVGGNVTIYTRVGDYHPVTGGEEYTILGILLETRSSTREIKFGFRQYDSTPAYLSFGNTSFYPAQGWNLLEKTWTLNGSAAYVLPQITQSGTEEDVFYVAGFALNPGDYNVWHLPSQAPGLVEFDTAPAEGSRITAAATGYRLAKCHVDLSPSWTWTNNQRTKLPTIEATEILEY